MGCWRVPAGGSSGGEYDLACFEAEQAAQLALKALLAELTGRAPCTRGLTELLGAAYRFLRNAGLDDAAREVASFAAAKRPRLWALRRRVIRVDTGSLSMRGLTRRSV